MVIDVRRYRDRAIVAIALAVALHEVLLGLVHAPARPDDREQVAQTTSIVIETPRPTPTPHRTPKPTPTPRPTPPPTPEPRMTVPPHATPAPVQHVAGRAKGRPARKHGGGAHKAIAKAPTGHYANPNAAGAGVGASTGNGAGNSPGSGGANGTNGSGDNGTGNGAVNADTPCGFVDFKPYAAPRYSGGTAYEPVQAVVTFPDGHTESARFPYPWIYPNGELNDPWSDTNLKKPDFEIPLQTPPPGADVGSYPPLVQYIVKHSNAQGLTLLPKCPTGRR